MPFKTVRTSTRPDTSIPFFKNTDEVRSYIKSTYDNTGKRLSMEITLSEDGLTETRTQVWASHAAYQEFKADPNIPNEAGPYTIEHGITYTVTFADV